MFILYHFLRYVVHPYLRRAMFSNHGPPQKEGYPLPPLHGRTITFPLCIFDASSKVPGRMLNIAYLALILWAMAPLVSATFAAVLITTGFPLSLPTVGIDRGSI